MALILIKWHEYPITVQYEDALEYRKAHRNVEPPVFNENRLFEAPIPELLDNNSIVDGDETVQIGELDENEVSADSPNDTENVDQSLRLNNNNGANSDAVDDASTLVEPVNNDVQIENENPNESTETRTEYENLFGAQQEDEINEIAEEDGCSDPLYINTAQFEIKCEHLDLIENHASNDDDIEKLLCDDIQGGETAGMVNTAETTITNQVQPTSEEKVDDDLFILIGEKGIPKPKEMRYKLVKHEEDLFSGNIPFDMTVSSMH